MTKRSFPIAQSTLVTALGLSLAACGGGGGDSTGTLSLGITDAPVDSAEAVVVRFTSVEIKPADGDSQTFSFDQVKELDLLALQGTSADALLDDETVSAGDYEWIRLHIDADQADTDSYITIDDSQHSLFIPSGAQSGLKLVQGFTVPANGSADFTIDFDLRKSVHKPGQSGQDYILRPALRLVDNTEVGHIDATVDGMQKCPNGEQDGPAMYVFEGSDVTPDDLDGTDPEPVSAANLTDDDTDGSYTGAAGYLTAGAYTAAFTCVGKNDDLDSDDDLAFEGMMNIEVMADEIAQYTHTVQ